MANPVKVLNRDVLLEKDMMEQQEKTQFVGERAAFGKEVNRRLTEDNISIYEQLGIMRKAIMHLITKHSDENDPELAEFLAFNARVEEHKAAIALEMSQHESLEG